MAAGQENAKLRVTFKTHVFSLLHDLKTSHMVISSNKSFVCPPDFASLHNLRIQPRSAPSADIYTVKKKMIQWYQWAFFWPLIVWHWAKHHKNYAISCSSPNPLPFRNSIFLTKKTETQKLGDLSEGKELMSWGEIWTHDPGLNHNASLPSLYYEGSFS